MAIRTAGHKVFVNSKDVGNLLSLGSIKQKRAIKEYEAINTGVIVQAIGNIKTDAISIGVLYNPLDVLGAKALETAFTSGATVPFSIELSDKLITKGTTFSWTGAVISDFEINQEQDGDVLATFSVSLNGAATVTAAV